MVRPKFKRAQLPADLALPEVYRAEIDGQPLTATEPIAITVPEDWQLGALLNVRNNGAQYCVTLFPEERDYQHPERTLLFSNSADCQNFVSQWYSRSYPHPPSK